MNFYIKSLCRPRAGMAKILLVMKIIVLLLTTAILQVSASSFAQKITLSEKDAPLEKVFKQIRNQSGYDFIFTNSTIKGAVPVSIQIKNADLEDVLKQIFASQPLEYVIGEKSVVIKEKTPSLLDKLNAVISNSLVIQSAAKDLNVKGRVVDQEGKPLPNASIRVKGKNTVTNSNENGEFEIKGVDEDAVLLVSYVGFKTLEIALKDAVMPLEIKLNMATGELEEVKVVYNTGYQELNKERATGSFVKIDKELFNRAVGTNVLDRIFDVTSGLINNPTNTTISAPNRIVIRGYSTIMAGKEPLIVVDNFPYDGDLNSLNPNDVESITVLKDAAAASIWGVRAGNGVIVITTKKGKFNQLTNIGFNSNVNIGQKPNIFYIPYLSSKEMIDFEKEQFGRGLYNAYDDTYPANNDFPVLPQSIEILLRARKMNKGVVGYNALNDPTVNAQLDRLGSYDVRNDINKYLLQNTISQQYALNLKGGGGSFNYYASIGYDQNRNNDIKSENNRLSLNFNNTWHPFKNLEIGSSIVHTRLRDQNSGSSYDSLLPSPQISPYTRLADEHGNPLAIPKTFRTAYIDTASYPALLDWHYRPLEDYKYVDKTNQNYDTRVSALLNYKIRPWLKAEFQYQNQITQSKLRSQYGQQSFLVRSNINRFMAKDATGKITYPYPVGDELSLNNSTYKSWNVRGSLNFNKQVGDHQLSAFAGMELRETTNESNFNTLLGFDPETYISKIVDVVNSFPIRPRGTSTVTASSSVDGRLMRNGSFFGNSAYNYKGKYLATVSGRIDQSNFFGVKANLRRVPLWHAGLAWNVHMEDFYNISWLSIFKLRASYGYTGNTNSGASSYPTFIYRTGVESVPPRNIVSGNLLTPNNPQLRWERVKIINVGIEFSLLNNRLNGTIDTYQKNGLDLLGSIDVDPTTGVISFTGNKASMKGQGTDFVLNTRNIVKSSFEWETDLLISFNSDKISAYYGAEPIPNSLPGSSGSGVVVGNPISSIYSFKWAGLDPQTGDPRIYLGDTISMFSNYSKATKSDIVFEGQQNPKIFGSFRNTIRWNNISISANITYRFGHYFKRQSINYFTFLNTPSWSGHADYALRWKKPGDELITDISSLPSIKNSGREAVNRGSSIFIEKADHIRLQDIRLSYRMDKNLFNKLPFREVSVYGYAANLGIIWKANKKGLDPDAFGFGSIPTPKTLAFGINASF